MEKYLKIPIIKDLIDTYGYINIEDCYNEYINHETLYIYENLNNTKLNYRQIYNHIKFIDYTGLGLDEYKRVSKFITSKNYMHFSTLFENINISDNLYKVLDYDVIKLYPNFDKNKWVINNFDKLENDSEILREYLRFRRLFSYYFINNNVYLKFGNYNLNLLPDKQIIKLLHNDLRISLSLKNVENIELIFKYMDDNNIEIKYEQIILLCVDNLNILKLVIEKAKLNNFDVSKLTRYNDDFMLDHSLLFDNFEIFKYIIDNGGNYKYIGIYHNKVKYIKYVYDKFKYIDYSAIMNNNMEKVEAINFLMNINNINN